MSTQVETSEEIARLNHETDDLFAPQALFERGVRLGDSLENGLMSTIDRFYAAAKPYAEEVLRQRPWLHPEFNLYYNSDPQVALLLFLRGAFSGNSYKVAFNQANVVWMLVVDDIPVSDVIGIQFNCLLKLSHTVHKIPKEYRRELLLAARDCRNVLDFYARVESALTGVHHEPKQTKLLTGSASAINAINEYETITREAGDKRPQAEKFGELATVATITEEAAQEINWQARAVALTCLVIREQDTALNGYTDTEILGLFCLELLKQRFTQVISYQEEIITLEIAKRGMLMHTCEECKNRINRHGGGHKANCEKGKKTAESLEKLRQQLQQELEKDAAKG